MSEELWFVIEEELEKSFSTISHIDVVYDEMTVKVGDEVFFFWNKKECMGKIRFMDEGYDKCILEAQRLNGIMRKEMKGKSLFDSNQPRKAAMKFKATLGQRVKRKKSADITNTVENNRQKILKEKKKKMENISSQRIIQANQSSAHKQKKQTSINKSVKNNKKENISFKSENNETIVEEENLHGQEKENSASYANTLKRKRVIVTSCSVTKSKNEKIYSSSESESDSAEKNEEQKSQIKDEEAEQISLSSGSEEEIDNIKDKQAKKVAARLAAMLDIKVLTKLASLNSSIPLSEENLQSLLFPQNEDKNKTSGEAIHNSGANNVQLVLNPATKEIVSLKCDESGAGSSGLIVCDHSNKIEPSFGSYHVNDNILQATKSTAIEEKTIPETVNYVISAGSGLKERAENGTVVKQEEQAENSTVVKQKGQTKNSNSMFCTDESKGILIGDDVYCISKIYKAAEESNSATKAVRRLLEGVFTLESLLQCTVSGLPPRGKSRQAYADPSSIKKVLEPAGVDAIIDKALEWQKLKHWRPKKDSTQLRSAMAVRLCEIREREQKRHRV